MMDPSAVPSSSPIIMASDHAGFTLKQTIKADLVAAGLAVEDCGPDSTASVDYPDFGKRVARKIADDPSRRGILICGTGIGMSITANRFPKVRAALCNDLFSAVMSRRHNDANILVMGGRVIGEDLAREIVRVWLETPFDGGRHQRRVEKLG